LAVNKIFGGKECVVLVAVVIADEHITVTTAPALVSAGITNFVYAFALTVENVDYAGAVPALPFPSDFEAKAAGG
jgi:hypothetical protein